MNERGIALLVVLWVLAGIGTTAALGLAAVRDGIATSRGRVESTRARWAADGCLALVRARLDRALKDRHDAWRNAAQAVPEGCAVRLTAPPDMAPDVNAAPPGVLAQLPGFDPVVVEAIVAARAWERRIESLDALLAVLPPEPRDRLAAQYAELVGRIAFEPLAWDVAADGTAEEAAARNLTAAAVRRPAVVERWVRAGARVAVVRRALP